MSKDFQKLRVAWIEVKRQYRIFISNWGFTENDYTFQRWCLQTDSMFEAMTKLKGEDDSE